MCCEAILRRDGNHATALQLLGVIRAQEGQLERAVELLQRAVATAPGAAEAHNNLGMALHGLKRDDDAVACYRTALALKPRYAIAHNNLGIALAALGRLEDAIAEYRQALALEPRYPEALNNFGRALNSLKRYAEAAEPLRHAIRLKPDFAEAHLNLGNVLGTLGRRGDAIEEFHVAASLQPNNTVVQIGVAAGLLAMNRHEHAIAHYEKASALDPHLTAALAGLGTALQELGRIDEARTQFEAAIAIEPRNPQHYAKLANAAMLSAADPHLQSMLTLARDLAAMSVEDRIALHFALGKALADSGDEERSFEHLLAGNALARQKTSYDEPAVLGRLERSRAMFSRELIETRKTFGNPSRQPIFILGMPRSGSTLVEQILARHRMVFAAGELEDFRAALRSVGLGTREVPYPDGVPALSDSQLRDIAAKYLASTEELVSPDVRRGIVQRITDKMPANFRYAGLIHMILPNARIIHTCRDPIDTCLSCFSIHFQGQPFTYDLTELGRYYRAYARTHGTLARGPARGRSARCALRGSGL